MDQSQAQRGHEPQAAGQPALSREVVQDRYDGVLGTCKGNIDKRLGLKLMSVLGEIAERTARHTDWPEIADGMIVDRALEAVERIIVDGVYEGGNAR